MEKKKLNKPLNNNAKGNSRRKKTKRIKKESSFLVKFLTLLLVLMVCFTGYLIYQKYGNNIPFLSQFLKEQKITSQEEIPKTDEKVNQPKPEIKKVINLPPVKEHKFRYTFVLNPKAKVADINFKMLVPQTERTNQQINITSVSPKPDKLYKTQDAAIAEYNFKNAGGKQIIISFEGIIKTRTYNIKTARLINKNIEPEENLSRYLKPEKYIESDDPMIVKIADSITGNSQEEIIQKIYEYGQNHLTYTIINDVGAKQALLKGRGQCSEYAAVMTALCRAKNIPARIVIGDFLRNYDSSHNWVEIYFDKYGWVTYDPTHMGVKTNDGKRILNAENTASDYIILGRNILILYPLKFYCRSRKNCGVPFSRKFEIF